MLENSEINTVTRYQLPAVLMCIKSHSNHVAVNSLLCKHYREKEKERKLGI